jgi:hypothetical protein
MSQGSQALQRIEDDFNEFRQQLEKCRQASSFEPVDWRNSYSSLVRVLERFKKEKKDLTDSERKELSNVFHKNKFISQMAEMRHVSDHIERTKSFTLYTPDKQPWTFDVGSSARSFFCSPDPYVSDVGGIMRHIEHRMWLEKWESTVAQAIARAKRSSQRRQ